MTGITAALGVCGACQSHAQEAIHEMLDKRSQMGISDFQNQPSTFTIKDLSVLITPSFGVDYNDNINTSTHAPMQDEILKPMVNFKGIYPWTDRNTLTFDVGIGYDQYVQHTDRSGVRITSGSGLNFDVGVGDFDFNFHDRFSYIDDEAGQSTIAGGGQYGSANNTVGVLGQWNLGDVTTSLGYDHLNLFSTSKTAAAYQSQDHSTEMFLERVGLKLNPEITAGLEATESVTAYDKRILNDNTSYTFGAYADWETAGFTLEPRLGYSIFQFNHTSALMKTASSDSWYADLRASAPLTKAISASFHAGHEVRLGIESDAVETWYVGPEIKWGIIDRGTLNFGVDYENGKQGFGNRSGNLGESYDYYVANMAFSYQITKRLTGSIHYRMTLRASSQADREYTQNLVGFQLAYPLR